MNAEQGSAYVFTRTNGVWTEQQKLTAGDGAAVDRFGRSVALSGDTALVGASFDDVGVNLEQGSAYVFVLRKSNGDACAAATECVSGFCADGVCCSTACGGGSSGDCLACSVAAGAAVDGTCASIPAGTLCRESAGLCDVGEVCDGQDAACPDDALAPAGTTCRKAASSCDVAEGCDGQGVACPADVLAVDGLECPEGACHAGVCQAEDSGGAGAGGGAPGEEGGCGCRTAGSAPGAPWGVLLAGLAALFGAAARMRRRRSLSLGRGEAQ
jgi:hypothetical protein